MKLRFKKAIVLIFLSMWPGFASTGGLTLCSGSTTVQPNSLYCAGFNPFGSGLVPQGPWWAYNNTANSGALRPGVDYTETMTIDPGNFPNNTSAAWSWPMTRPAWTIYSFVNLVFGDNGGYTAVQGAGHPPATQVKNVVRLTSTFSYTYADSDPPVSGLTSNFDVAYDLFLTSVSYSFIPKDGLSQMLFEIMIFVHPNWTPGGTSEFTYTSAGATWNVSLNRSARPPAITVTPADDVLSGTFDIGGLFQKLASHGIITGNEYLAGLSFGAEVACCNGSLMINSLSYDWINRDDVQDLSHK